MSTYHDHSTHSTAFVSSPDAAGQEQELAQEQLITLRSIARARGRDCDQFVRSRFGCAPEELSRAEAAACINALAELLDAQPPGLHACASLEQTKENNNTMSSFNKITVVGYLGRAPELRYTPEGTPVSNFSVATTERRKDKSGELQETTTWFQVALFGRRAEVANEYLSKGSHVWLEGPLTLNQWTDREGAARVNLEVRASDIKFLSSSAEKATAAAAAAEVTTEDDVAF
ncbi:MAG: single-stranded DNA-binding protein [Acidobacteriota bacterium]